MITSDQFDAAIAVMARETWVPNLARWMGQEPRKPDRYWERVCRETFGSPRDEARKLVKAAREHFLESRGQMRLFD